MGIYHRFVNDETQERVELSQIAGGNVKWSGVIMGAGAHIFMYLVMTAKRGTWHVLSDAGGFYPSRPRDFAAPTYYECGLSYKDITHQVIERYNEACSSEADRITWRGE
jgi:hypothetical protein